MARPTTRSRVGLLRMARSMRSINEAGADRARLLCELIVQEIRNNPKTPYDPRTSSDTRGEHLRDSYYARESPTHPGEWEVVSTRRYARFVEFGTREHGGPQPHVRPAIELVRQLFR